MIMARFMSIKHQKSRGQFGVTLAAAFSGSDAHVRDLSDVTVHIRRRQHHVRFARVIQSDDI